MALGSARSIEELHPDVVALALRRLDGAALAAASCASARLRELASDPALWRDLCVATWPSLRHPDLLPLLLSPRRLFADASPFPVPKPSPPLPGSPAPPPRELISAVDLYRGGGAPLLSRVVATDASSAWFLGSPFRIDALDRKSPPPPPAAAAAAAPCPAAELELSWILIDPARGGRAVNLSSRRPVAVDRHWYTGETLIRYATVAGEFLIEATVTCGEETGHVREVSLRVGDADGAAVCGGDSLVILGGLMEGERRRRRGGGEEEEEAKRRYEDFVNRKRNRKAAKARNELLLDFCCSAVGAAVFLAFVLTALLR